MADLRAATDSFWGNLPKRGQAGKQHRTLSVIVSALT